MTPKIIVAVVAATLTSAVQGHFTFVRLAHNGVWQDPLRYVRNKTSPYDDTWFEQPGLPPAHWYNFPTTYNNKAESVRCGRDNMAHAANTDVLHVKAGDEIEIAQQRYDPTEWTDSTWSNCPDGRGTCVDSERPMDINHPGPVLVHLGPVPSGMNVREYDGTGEWTKIYTLGFEYHRNETQYRKVDWLAYNWGNTPVPRFAFKIPPQTPSGQYLLRMDIVWATWQFGGAQLYPSCAQIEVSGTSSEKLPPGVKIPEIFSPDSPGMTISREMTSFESVDADYTHPGGPIWDGGKLVTDKPVFED